MMILKNINLDHLAIRIVQAITLLFLMLSLAGQVSAINGHNISKLKVTTTPKNPKVGQTLSECLISFQLTSSTGIDADRIKVFVNNQLSTTSEDDFSIDTISSENGSETASVLASLNNVKFNVESNSIRVEYWLTRTNGNPPQAGRSVAVGADGSNSSGDGTSTSNGTNGSVAVPIPDIIQLSVDESSESNIGRVSNSTKQFSLTFIHDPNVVDIIDDDNFDANTNVLLNNLKIAQYDYFTDDKIDNNIKDQFSFELESPSVTSDSSTNGSLLTTVITASIPSITEASTLKFTIDLEKFIEDSQITVNSEAATEDTVKIKVKPLESNFSTLSLSQNDLTFSPVIIASDSKQELQIQDLNINAVFNNSNFSITEIEDIKVGSYSKDKTQAYIKIPNSKSKLNLEGKMTDDASLTTSDSTSIVTIPLKLSSKTSRNTFLQEPEFVSISSKQLVLPIEIIAKTSNGLDILITGEYQQTQNINFLDHPIFTKANKAKVQANGSSILVTTFYSNTVANDIDPLKLTVTLMNNVGSPIAQPVVVENISTIVSKKKNSKNQRKLVISVAHDPATIEQASIVDLSIGRDADYLNDFGLTTDPQLPSNTASTADKSSLQVPLKK